MILSLILSMLVTAAPMGNALVAQESDAAQELAAANEAYAKFDNNTALQHYLKALEIEPTNYEALWKAARTYADVGKSLEKDKKKAKATYALGDSLARKAVELYPDSADGHFALALCVGRVALFEGGKTKIRMSKEVKAEADKAVELSPCYGAAYHILGRWNYNIATLGWMLKTVAKMVYGGVPEGATVENAAVMFEKAIECEPDKPVHRLQYGRTLIKLNRYAEAREQLQKCLDLPQVQWEDPAHKKEAEKLLKKIKNKK